MISIAYLISAVDGPPKSLSSSAKASRYNSRVQQAQVLCISSTVVTDLQYTQPKSQILTSHFAVRSKV